jgi:hypothetical protein
MALRFGQLFRAATRRWLGPFARTRHIVKVTVRDENFHIIRVLTSDKELLAFRDLWSGLVEIDPGSWVRPPGASHRKLDIQWTRSDGRTHTSRWHYHPGGYIRILGILRAIWVAPLYRTPTPTAFEALLAKVNF